jgi:Domain of Unknown Function (DUF1080)
MRPQIVVLAALLLGGVEWPYAARAVGQGDAGWVTLFDGTNLNQWNTIGDANWKLVDGVVQADTGTGFLVSKSAYGDFQLRAEFWVDTPANSGIFLRCSDPSNVTAANAYEVNIFDTRPDPAYGTGAIVNVAKVSPMPKAGGQWNTFEITARGSHLTVTLNGTRTAEGDDSQHARGPIALQHGAGVVKFRKVQIKPL